MRRIDESIESLTPLAADGPAHGAPLAFRWRGRRYVVGSVLAHWVETGAWWRQGERVRTTAQPPPDPERWLWRVEAGSRGSQTGVFDLCLEVDRSDAGRWSLYAIYD